MTSDGAMPPDEPAAILYVGQHESERSHPVTSELLSRAQSIGYDLLTTPITTQHFQSRVLAVLNDHVKELSTPSSAESIPLPLLPPLTPQDSNLTPGESNSSLIAVTSSWIDTGSKDPLIAHISRHVFNIEVAYAAFCGISNVLVYGPVDAGGTVQYARAVLEALGLGPYLQLHVLLPMNGELEQDISANGTHLAELARPQYAQNADEDEEELDMFGTWDVWNTIRTMCSHSNKLSIGTRHSVSIPISPLSYMYFSLLSACSYGK